MHNRTNDVPDTHVTMAEICHEHLQRRMTSTDRQTEARRPCTLSLPQAENEANILADYPSRDTRKDLRRTRGIIDLRNVYLAHGEYSRGVSNHPPSRPTTSSADSR